MDVLGRESAPINAALWNQIDEAVIETARKLLTGRRFYRWLVRWVQARRA